MEVNVLEEVYSQLVALYSEYFLTRYKSHPFSSHQERREKNKL